MSTTSPPVFYHVMPQTTEKWFGMRLASPQKARIERLAERKGTSQKEAVLAAVSRELSEAESAEVKLTCPQ